MQCSRLVTIILLPPSFLFLFGHTATAQKLVQSQHHYAVHLTPPTKTIDIIVDSRDKPTPKIDRTYYWYDNVAMHETKGSYAGHVLDGPYREFNFPGNHPLLMGEIRLGVRHGKWTSWYSNGNLKEVSEWYRGYYHGKRRFYNEQGDLIREEIYNNNKPIGIAKNYVGGLLVDDPIFRGNVQKPRGNINESKKEPNALTKESTSRKSSNKDAHPTAITKSINADAKQSEHVRRSFFRRIFMKTSHN